MEEKFLKRNLNGRRKILAPPWVIFECLTTTPGPQVLPTQIGGS